MASQRCHRMSAHGLSRRSRGGALGSFASALAPISPLVALCPILQPRITVFPLVDRGQPDAAGYPILKMQWRLLSGRAAHLPRSNGDPGAYHTWHLRLTVGP